jgi:hypothetical protein
VSNGEPPQDRDAEGASKPGAQSTALTKHEDSNSVPQQLKILADLEKQRTDLEKQRIESYNRRTDVARYAIEMNDAADKRQFEYRMAELEAGRTSSIRRHALAQKVAVGSGLGGGLIIALLLIMAFFGSSEQSAIAIQIFIVLGIGVGGYGAIETVVRAVSRLFKEEE